MTPNLIQFNSSKKRFYRISTENQLVNKRNRSIYESYGESLQLIHVIHPLQTQKTPTSWIEIGAFACVHYLYDAVAMIGSDSW